MFKLQPTRQAHVNIQNCINVIGSYTDNNIAHKLIIVTRDLNVWR